MLVRRRSVISPLTVPQGISVTCIEDLARRDTGKAVVGSEGSALVLGWGQGGISRMRFRAPAGTKWIATGEVAPAMSGDLLPCKFGPLLLDDSGGVKIWFQSIPVTFPEDRPMQLRVQMVAPEGEHWVVLGMMGPSSQERQSTATYRFTNCRLVRADLVDSSSENP